MKMNHEKFIPVFIDAKPSENLEPANKSTLCFVGVLSNSMEGVKKLKGYKRTKRKLKLDSAQRIIDTLNTKSYEVDAIGFGSRTDLQFVQWACDTINSSRARIGAEWDVLGNIPTHFRWNNERIDRATVLGLSTYASILPIIALRAEMLTRGSETSKIKLCLDNLPNNSDWGMDLMRALGDDPKIAPMWRENMSHGATFEIGIFHKWKNRFGRWVPGKLHPNSILVDWFAASCMANVNPGQLKTEGNYSDKEVEKIAEIWHASSSDDIRDLDDPELQKKINAHNNV